MYDNRISINIVNDSSDLDQLFYFLVIPSIYNATMKRIDNVIQRCLNLMGWCPKKSKKFRSKAYVLNNQLISWF